jgi:tagatose-6-phosphate ketose/aldose isomerase
MQKVTPSSDAQIRPPGTVTHAEIFQQPQLWPTTLDIVGHSRVPPGVSGQPVVVTGAGTSAYAAVAIAASWRRAQGIPTTDLLLDPTPFYESDGLLISLARSGDSPESIGVVEKVQRLFPAVEHLAITCNANGKLANAAGVHAIVLDPRTNDRSLAMTSSFSNLVLAGLALRHAARLSSDLPAISKRAQSGLTELDELARTVAARPASRIAILASRPLFGAAREASLKILEMTAGQCVAVPETFLGLRHGPMSFLRADTLVLCFLSTNPLFQRYEEDLISELKAKGLGYIVGIGSDHWPRDIFNDFVPAAAPELPDFLRTPFEIIFPQLLAYHLSLRVGLNPDNPSPDGVITRVVKGVRIHEE